ncbi:SDR family oxidoreductase [Cytobacillus oceanisediminis]|uniref:SDR family oxidoreductase n=1 Tax=Niallia alba TaxID=2729105 RepID=A0A7Y0K5C4_9BACI|nr:MULTISPECIES: SDR family oxidoreductase [Bacillaceae]EOR22597.1 putative NAD(P)-dependent epimerase/dehydratase [Niallia nealsonii AAU1]MBZ9534892.1 SDR family oxidoreductase [Cytobacillus oceanisediminis]NMO75971.1 SDR family oxidoreductase [Niallia alba]UTI43776.1 SDR family oxidoreductase [Niallia sp. RD1]
MKVLVVGANGQIGKQLVTLLHESNEFSVRALVRTSDQQKAFDKVGIETALGNLEETVEQLESAVKGCDAVVFTAGSGGKTGYDKTLLIDLDGAVKMMEATKNAGVERFVMVSALQAHRRENWNEQIKPYYVAKHYADRILMESGLTYTIIRPGRLTNDAGTGLVAAAENLEKGVIPREDVAATIMASIKEKNVFNKLFDLVSGETEMEKAVKNL